MYYPATISMNVHAGTILQILSLLQTTSSAIHNGEKLSELRKIKNELETENTRLKATLNVQQEQAKEDVARAEVRK